MDGDDGVSSFTLTSASFVVPAKNATVAIGVLNNSWMAIGQFIFIPGAGTFTVTAKAGTTSATLRYEDYVSNTFAGATISSGAIVTPGGAEGPTSTGTVPTSLTDNSAGTASNVIAVGVGRQFLIHPLTSLATGLSTLAIDLLTTFTPGFRFSILACDFVTTVVGAGAGASQVFNLEIGTVNVSGGVVTVTLASTATIGAITAGTAVTSANIGTASDTISLEMAAGGTVFTSGAGYFIITLKNLDAADAFASLSAKVNAIILAIS